MEYKCEYCGCFLKSRRLFYNHKREIHHIKNGQQPIIQCNCKFCGREFNRIASRNRHENNCNDNPNKVIRLGHKVSEETKKKISEGMKKAHAEGRANEWQGRRERSYAEQSWYNIFANDFGLESFVNNYFVKKYWLDFAWVDKKIYFEVDGRTHFTEEGKKHDLIREQFLLDEGWKLIGRCNWSEYQKLSRQEKENYVQEIEQKIKDAL